MADISNSEDIIDSRDVIERIEELEGERQTLADALEDAESDLTLAAQGDGDSTGELTETVATAKAELADWDADNGAELASLRAFAKAGEDYAPDWAHGATLIRDTYFTEYAEELAHDIGAIDKNAGWPLAHIDWDAAADALKSDYTEIDFDGATYLVR